jgi:hypothetical protein
VDRYLRRVLRAPLILRVSVGLALLIVFQILWWTDWQYAGHPLVALGMFVLLAELVALEGMLLARRCIPLASLEAHREVAGYVYSTLGAAYAVLLSFLVVISWNRFDADQRTIRQEAAAAATLFHLADGLGAAPRQELQQALLAYIQVVLADEWEALTHGVESAQAWYWSDQLWDIYMRAPPEEQGRPAYPQSLSKIQEFYDLRGQRLVESRSSLPSAIWVVLLGGATVTVGFTYLFGVRSPAAQGVMTVALTAIIAGSLYLIVDLDTPYSGPVRVMPTPYQTTLAFFTARLQQSPAEPLDSAGQRKFGTPAGCS